MENAIYEYIENNIVEYEFIDNKYILSSKENNIKYKVEIDSKINLISEFNTITLNDFQNFKLFAESYYSTINNTYFKLKYIDIVSKAIKRKCVIDNVYISCEHDFMNMKVRTCGNGMIKNIIDNLLKCINNAKILSHLQKQLTIPITQDEELFYNIDKIKFSINNGINVCKDCYWKTYTFSAFREFLFENCK